MKASFLDHNTHLIKTLAANYGFDYCGIAQARKLEEHEMPLEQWLNKQYHGSMDYMANHFEKRLDPTRLMPGAKSVISLIYNYYPEKELPTENNYKIAKYAYGRDYHFVIKSKLKSILQELIEDVGDIEARVFVDSAPVMERQWAELAGIGWRGKNSLLLNRNMGSFFFLAEIITDLEFNYDGPAKDYCGTCTVCIDVCPTDAIPQPYVIDANKCISYLTIELKDNIPNAMAGQFEDWVFGCDICQDVCPWNRFSKPHQEKQFQPHEKLIGMNKLDWRELTQEVFNEIFKKSPLKRAKYSGIQRNVKFLSANK